jgi:hypothetical protein
MTRKDAAEKALNAFSYFICSPSKIALARIGVARFTPPPSERIIEKLVLDGDTAMAKEEPQ